MVVKYKFHITSLIGVSMAFFKEVIKNKYPTVYYPALKGAGNLGYITKHIPGTAKVLWETEGVTLELSLRFVSVLVLNTGFDYVKNKQARVDIHLGIEFFENEEDYIFFLKELSYKSKVQYGSPLYCDFEIDLNTGLPTENGKQAIRERISKVIQRRKRNNDNKAY